MKFSTIFIGGVHGVGKGYLSSRLSENFDYERFSASDLIKQEKNRPVDINKVVIDSELNQTLLIRAFERLNPSSKTVLLDGHFVLQEIDKITNVPQCIFERLNLKVIFLLTDSVDIIKARLLQRDGKSLHLDKIISLQSREVECAHKISKALNLPIIEGHSQDMTPYLAFLKAANGYKV